MRETLGGEPLSMDRRSFLQSAALGLAAPAARPNPAPPQQKCWIFWDLWKLDSLHGATLRQGRPRWRPEHTHADPLLGSLSSWPAVHRDAESGRWRMYYGAAWRPLTLLAAESDDGLHWEPLARPASEFASAPGGQQKIAPHHLFTLPSGSGGSVYFDPVAADGYPYKLFAIQTHSIARERALADPSHPFHELARKTDDAPRYFSDHLVVRSRDGFRWEADYEAVWNKPGWHPEPPVYAFYNAARRRHTLTSRPGHGDRRVVILDSPDARQWSGPELLLQPDSTDEPLLQFYGMPVFPYGGAYVGLLWTFHLNSTDPVQKYNRSLGWIDCQLAYSYDGVRFQRGLREPFIPRTDPGELGSGHIQPSALVDTGDEIRIYSTGGQHSHGMGSRFDDRRGMGAILCHTLRRDGFFYLESDGAWAQMTSKPMRLDSDSLTMNIEAPHGEARYQITDLEGRPLPGLRYDDCVPALETDDTAWTLRFREQSLRSALGKPVRIEVRWLHGRLYGFRGSWHFLDAQDMHLLDDGRPISPQWFDY